MSYVQTRGERREESDGGWPALLCVPQCAYNSTMGLTCAMWHAISTSPCLGCSDSSTAVVLFGRPL